jgi:hypothetical protein
LSSVEDILYNTASEDNILPDVAVVNQYINHTFIKLVRQLIKCFTLLTLHLMQRSWQSKVLHMSDKQIENEAFWRTKGKKWTFLEMEMHSYLILLYCGHDNHV